MRFSATGRTFGLLASMGLTAVLLGGCGHDDGGAAKAPSTPTESVQLSDYGDPHAPGTYVFTTASRKFRCMLVTSAHQPAEVTCGPDPQNGGAFPADLPAVPDRDPSRNRSAAPNLVDLIAGRPPALLHTRLSPVFDVNATFAVLPAGKALGAGTLSCDADDRTGVGCRDQNGHSFRISTDTATLQPAGPMPTETVVAALGIDPQGVLTYRNTVPDKPEATNAAPIPDGPTLSAPFAADATIMSIGTGPMCGKPADHITVLPNGRADHPCAVDQLRTAPALDTARATLRLIDGHVVALWELAQG